jgi:hypothetical protein
LKIKKKKLAIRGPFFQSALFVVYLHWQSSFFFARLKFAWKEQSKKQLEFNLFFFARSLGRAKKFA